ncbi:MAG: hypothetical protein PVF82_14515 [Gammaproteobacteria bacterium]
MTMKFTQLTTYWNAEEAYTVIEFLDRLRDLLWATYGEEIVAMLKAESENNPDSDESDPEFDDEIDF